MKMIDTFLCAAKRALFYIPLVAIAISCSDKGGKTDEDDAEKEAQMSAIVEQYVDKTVVKTYRSLADESIVLYNALEALKADKTAAKVEAAAASWVKARDYWELSEAFLFGAASDFGIDPHIDTWPLAKDELVAELANDAHIASMAGEEGDVWVADFLGYALLGFHGIEYILFEDGQPKAPNSISDKEIIYAAAVAGDLRNQCFRLEAAWAGIDNVSSEKKAKIEELEMIITTSSGKLSYGADMKQAGKAGSTKMSVADACETIIEGCITIADEVGAMKIGMPYTGEDVNYIESPYSFNSKADFIGNIISIQNAYLGGVDKNARDASVSAYIKRIDAAVDADIIAAIDKALAAINAIPYPFARHFTSNEAGAAMDACNDLAEVLTGAKNVLNK
ncbi:MAG: peptidase M75 [Tannerellaceae bacterium]|jgi:hypothetical protein|nr:peptidase M75 [Tannerellaceae bacterium]